MTGHYLRLVAFLLLGTANLFGNEPTLVVVVGAEGTEEYGASFRTWAGRWQQAAENNAQCYVIGVESVADRSDRDLLQERLQAESLVADHPLWLVLIGHGTYYRDVAKFNARGSDFSASDLSSWLAKMQRPVGVINCTSSSGPFLNALSGPGRVVVTATKSGNEQNFSRFGEALSSSINDSSADLDHDNAVSLLEAFLHASDEVSQFYAQEARLATEHALLDDNGDQLGTSAEFFHGVRAVKAPAAGAAVDGDLAKRWVLRRAVDETPLSPEDQIERERLESELDRLRSQQVELPEKEYLDQLEAILVPLAQLGAKRS